MKRLQSLSLVIPIYNEEETLPLLSRELEGTVKRLRVERDLAVECILVDDGSVDGSYAYLENWARRDTSVKVLKLSRNFGHQLALTAGLDAANGDAVVSLDGDLQDPPEVIFDMLDRVEDEGLDVVYARREEREGETLFKRGTAWLFYRLMKKLIHRELPEDSGDFRLITGEALAAYRSLRERHRFLRGLSTWIGFRQGSVSYRRPARAAGETKYPTSRMLRLAWNATTSFSTLPLSVVTAWGTLVSAFGLGYLVYAVGRHLIVGDTVPGWSTLVVLLCLIGGSVLVGLGIVGSYVGKIYEEVKQRPLYLVQTRLNFNPETAVELDDSREGVDVSRLVGTRH